MLKIMYPLGLVKCYLQLFFRYLGNESLFSIIYNGRDVLTCYLYHDEFKITRVWNFHENIYKRNLFLKKQHAELWSGKSIIIISTLEYCIIVI